MSGFTALNVEPEDTFEEDIDDTKEIQIEDAFKLYQNALKLHSQGPDFYDAADEAYQELFRSEVFKYPEIVTDYGHEQLDDIVSLPAPSNDQASVPVLPTNAADSAANSLPQLIYLSFKNRGQFILDVARHELDGATLDRKRACWYYYQYCLKGLTDSASALERDDTDLDLWKKSARIADVLSSQRLVRFCLESVVAGDDETGEQTVDLSGLDEAYASHELLQVLRLVQDDVGTSEAAATQAQEKLLYILKKSNDPYPYLPHRAPRLEYLYEKQQPSSFRTVNVRLDVAGHTQAALAEALASAMGKNTGGNAECTGLGAFVDVSFPSSPGVSSVNVAPIADTLDNPADTAQDKASHMSPGQSQAVHSDDSAHSPASFHSAPDEVHPILESNSPDQKPSDDNPLGLDVPFHNTDQGTPGESTQLEMRLPTRKRSSTAAGNDEPEARVKSKRLRARESLMEVAAQEEETAQENDYYAREQLAIIDDSDTACLAYVKTLLAKLDVRAFMSIDASLNSELSAVPAGELSYDRIDAVLIEDMKQAVSSWTEDTSVVIMTSHGSRDDVEKSGGMSLFQRHLTATLPKESKTMILANADEVTASFAHLSQQSKQTLADMAISWLIQLLTSSTKPRDLDASYLRSAWSLDMRNNIVHVIMQVDHLLLDWLLRLIRDASFVDEDEQQASLSLRSLTVAKAAELIQTLFEIHLDEYYKLTGAESRSATIAEREQRDRLQRWAHIATDIIQIYHSTFQPEQTNEPVALRFLLVSAIFTGLLAEDDKTHVLNCLGDVRTILQRQDFRVIALPNNSAVPQISLAAIDQEISRLSTLDFFNSIFESDNNDPISIIMKLEPILEPDQIVAGTESKNESTSDTNHNDKNKELRSFLDSGDAALKLFLWRRLQNAYTAISYTPKVVSCLLRSLEVIVQEIQSERRYSYAPAERRLTMLKWLREADEIMIKALTRISEEPKAFECVEEHHLRSSLAAVTALLELLREFVRFDDSIRLGQITPPALRTSSATRMFEKARDKLRDIFVRGWTILYYLLKEATIQVPEHFDRPVDELAEYLRLVHNALGHRQYCKQCNKIFVKLAKKELLSTQSKINYTEDIAQILFDMYQIKLGTGFGDMNHGCSADVLGRDKDTAFNLVPIIMAYARKLSMRELIKSDLKNTIDRTQQTLGQVKSSPALSSNRKAVSTFLKSPINPQEVYRSLKGIGDLLIKPVYGEYANIAAQGWYQILGGMSLAKYKSIKRVNPTPTDDLDTAATYLRLDLEHDITSWETWYRLAQVFDAKIEDSLIWNALKINDSRGEIASLERNAINAYTMAIAMAMRTADDGIETVQKISEMFSEFAFRLYASSRPPLSMEAFNTDKHMRHLSNSQDSSMSKTPFVLPFKPYTVWGFAAHLLQRKFATGQKEWLCYYTLGKCFWKMLQSDENAKARKSITVDDVIDAFADAVELVPAKEKSSDYILEPHYKLVSVVHKLVHRQLVSPTKGAETLQATQFARAVHFSRDDQDSDWEAYVLEILRKLGHADKSNWHHRITARAAHINYDDNQNVAGALGAKHQFTQQIFTKTMTMQVWKPEYERPGRHYVYTGRYLSFFVHLLDKLNDRASLEQLIRRIRRKTTDFLDHPKVWEETALTYVNLLRRVGKIPWSKERDLFDKISYDEFAKASERVEKWAHDPENTSLFQDVMQDAIELKKLNNSLMKGPAIDDLIGDAYACLYEACYAQVGPDEIVPPTAVVLPQGTFINMNTDIVPTGDDNLDRMRLNNLLHAQTDGSSGTLAPTSTALGLNLPLSRTGTPPAETVRIPTPSKPGRVKTITRREVQRKAEACVIKPAPIKTPTLAKRPFIDIPSRRDSALSSLLDGQDNERPPESSRVSSRQPSASLRGSAEPSDADQDADGEVGDDQDGEADDESGLSDVDNDDDEQSTKTGVDIMMSKKRKAEDDDDDEQEEENDGEDGEDEPEDDMNDEDGDGDGVDMDLARETMDAEEGDENVMEIQDSQGAAEKPREMVEDQPLERRVSRNGRKRP